jgi:hypothetical protein
MATESGHFETDPHFRARVRLRLASEGGRSHAAHFPAYLPDLRFPVDDHGLVFGGCFEAVGTVEPGGLLIWTSRFGPPAKRG